MTDEQKAEIASLESTIEEQEEEIRRLKKDLSPTKAMKMAQDALNVVLLDPEIKLDDKAVEQCSEAANSLDYLLKDRGTDESIFVSHCKAVEEILNQMDSMVTENGVFVKILSSSRGQKLYGTLSAISAMSMNIYEVRRGIGEGWISIEKDKKE